MDPVTLATITSGVTLVATEAGKELAGQAGKDVWARIKSALGWTEEPAPEQLAPAVAERLSNDEQTARRVVELLREAGSQAGPAAAIVGQVDVRAKNMTVIGQQTVQGNQTFNM